MDLVERYLNAVRFWLPKAQKQDIISELAEDIRSQVEEREAALGRALSEAETADLLKERGSPFAVAGRFLPQRHLIGPALFPIYLFVLKLAAGLYLAPWLFVWICLVLFVPSYRAAHPGSALFDTLGTLWTSAVFSFAMITLGFAIGERIQAKSVSKNEWNPRRLPAARDRLKIPRFNSVASIVVDAVFLVWWLGGYSFPAAFSTDGAPLRLMPTPLWADFRTRYLAPVAILAAAGMVLAAGNLLRPFWTRTRLGVRAALDATAAAVMISLLGAHSTELLSAWHRVTSGAAALPKSEMIQTWAGLSVAIILGFVALGCLISLFQSVIRIVRWDPGKAPSASNPGR